MHYYCFDFRGEYLGYVDRDGMFYDNRGNRWGRVNGNCRVYDLDGRYCGWINAQGSFFAEDRTCRGYLRDWAGRTPPPACRPGAQERTET